MPVSPAAHLVTFTRKSNHAACPVIGSEVVRRRWSPAPTRNDSEIRWLRRNPAVARESPRPGLLAYRVPGPHRVRLHAFHRLQLTADLSVVRFDPDPVEVAEAQVARRRAIHVQEILRQDLPQPDVLRVPGVVHH